MMLNIYVTLGVFLGERAHQLVGALAFVVIGVAPIVLAPDKGKAGCILTAERPRSPLCLNNDAPGFLLTSR